MEQLIPQVLPYIGPSALPLLIVVLFYMKIKNDRSKTKILRDEDSQKTHDELLALKFKVTALEGIVNLHRDKLESIEKQLNLVNQELVKLNMTVEHLADALEKQNDIMLRSLEKRNAGE